ncbi:hypothetical protein CHU98_g11784 [Xylaria longipes]|nr:hypothetical protein CHU98_g11784 [Xylaria longipes]
MPIWALQRTRADGPIAGAFVSWARTGPISELHFRTVYLVYIVVSFGLARSAQLQPNYCHNRGSLSPEQFPGVHSQLCQGPFQTFPLLKPEGVASGKRKRDTPPGIMVSDCLVWLPTAAAAAAAAADRTHRRKQTGIFSRETCRDGADPAVTLPTKAAVIRNSHDQ